MVFAVVRWGPVGVGTFDASFCTFGGVFKEDADAQDCMVANEYICNRLALALGLPAPPGGLVKIGAGESDRPAFASLRFGSLSETPPPVVPEDLVHDNAYLASGIAAFDCWIANPDRHESNLAYRKGSIPLAIMDHALCLAGESRAGIANLPKRIEEPARPSCISPLIRSARHLSMWSHSIKALPVTTIWAILQEVKTARLVSASEANLIARFLVYRRSRLSILLPQLMPQISDWGLL